MNEQSKNLIKEEILNLPKEIQEAINSLEWEKISEEIGKKHLLDENEMETFQLETACFLLDLIDKDVYTENIESKIGIGSEEARKITKEVFEEIINPIDTTMEENIKNNLQNKNPSPIQNLNFVLSGGDYSVFMKGDKNQEEEKLETKQIKQYE